MNAVCFPNEFDMVELLLFGLLVIPTTTTTHYCSLTSRLVVVISLPLLITNNITTRTIYTTFITTATNLKLRDAFSTLPYPVIRPSYQTLLVTTLSVEGFKPSNVF
jgi:hypothetical protein